MKYYLILCNYSDQDYFNNFMLFAVVVVESSCSLIFIVLLKGPKHAALRLKKEDKTKMLFHHKIDTNSDS